MIFIGKCQGNVEMRRGTGEEEEERDKKKRIEGKNGKSFCKGRGEGLEGEKGDAGKKEVR